MLSVFEKESYYPEVINSTIYLFFIVKLSLLPVVADKTHARLFYGTAVERMS